MLLRFRSQAEIDLPVAAAGRLSRLHAWILQGRGTTDNLVNSGVAAAAVTV